MSPKVNRKAFFTWAAVTTLTLSVALAFGGLAFWGGIIGVAAVLTGMFAVVDSVGAKTAPPPTPQPVKEKTHPRGKGIAVQQELAAKSDIPYREDWAARTQQSPLDGRAAHR